MEGRRWNEITNYKIQITNKSQITMSQITNKKTKKPSVGPKGLIGPPCHGALAAGGKGEKNV